MAKHEQPELEGVGEYIDDLAQALSQQEKEESEEQ